MKLDAEVLRYMSRDEFRVLQAIELGMRNHALVPTKLIPRIAGMSGHLFTASIKLLHKNKLVYHENVAYDGFRLTYCGYDFLALNALIQRGQISALGHRIGVGKEADVYAATNERGDNIVLKLHRLGRISFRRIKEKRDYLQGKHTTNWLYLSRLAAQREYSYLCALHEHEFPVPTPIDCSRHVICMQYVDATPFGQIHTLKHTGRVYSTLMNLIIQLAEHGLIHCDFNEFNLMINQDTEEITLIDFPQMVSTSHANAQMYFDRDVQGVRTYFHKRFGYHSGEFPTLADDVSVKIELDKSISASGADTEAAERHEFEKYMDEYNHPDEQRKRAAEQADEQSNAQSVDEDEDDEDDEDGEEELEMEEVDAEVAEDSSDNPSTSVQFDETVNQSINPAETSTQTDNQSESSEDEEAAFRERMARKDARKNAERMKQQHRLDRKKQSNNPSSVAPTSIPSATEKPSSDVPAPSSNDQSHNESVNQLHTALLQSVHAKVKIPSNLQMVGKGRNVSKNRAALKLRANIDAQI